LPQAGPGASYPFASIAFWPADGKPNRQRHSYEFVDDVELPQILEVDAWQAVEDLEFDAAAFGGVPPWREVKEGATAEAGASRPATVSMVAGLLLLLAMVHSVGALGSFSLGLDQNGLGRAIIAGGLALAIGIGETVCAVQMTRGRAWARMVAAGMGALMLIWLTMAPWTPGVLTVVVFVAWLAVGALLAHPLTSRFFEAMAPREPPEVDGSLAAA
jgi:hypothetical protein